MGLKLADKVVEFLQKKPESKFTAQQIADWILEKYPDECRQKQERSTATVNPLGNKAALRQQITAEIGSQRPQLQKKHHKVKTTEGRPRKYYFTELTDSAEIDRAENKGTTKTDGHSVKEHDLYPVLSKFLWSKKIYSKRIDEKRSGNTQGPGGNKWLYPDLVGLENLSSDWHDEIKECAQQHGGKKTKLWSFEVKSLINRSNLRQAFFQAVSNSTWANFGYLVAGEITGDGDTRGDTIKELRILSSLHGIGFILLDAKDPSESQIMIPAKERIEIDWDTVSRLTEENYNFRENYIKLTRQFYQTGEIRESDWDGCKDLDEHQK